MRDELLSTQQGISDRLEGEKIESGLAPRRDYQSSLNWEMKRRLLQDPRYWRGEAPESTLEGRSVMEDARAALDWERHRKHLRIMKKARENIGVA